MKTVEQDHDTENGWAGLHQVGDLGMSSLRTWCLS